ncbi:MAG: Fur family transcriptional regulator [Pseudomonadota bacterium]
MIEAQHAHDANKPHTPKETEVFLDEAEAIAESKGQKLTPIRRKVLELLLDSREPAKAYDLLEKIEGYGAAKPPTIYRALDFLQSVGLAHKIESLNAYVACGHINHEHSAVFLICDKCGGAEELHADATSSALGEDLRAAGFEIKATTIEARGICRDCNE